MPKTFPIMIEVEEIALGTVLRKLNEMPGIARLHLDLTVGGTGKVKSDDGGGGDGGKEDYQKKASLFLLGGPKHITEISKHLGGAKGRGYGAMHNLKNKGIAEPGPDPSTYQLTAKARAAIEAAQGKGVALLPKPRAAASKANGHSPPKANGHRRPAAASKGRDPGKAVGLILGALAQGPQDVPALRAALEAGGLSPTSWNGRSAALKTAGLIKTDDAGTYECTAKGRKVFEQLSTTTAAEA